MLFKHFDYLASIYGFTFDDSMRYQTNCGGFLSIILTLIALVTVGQMGSTFLNRTSPTVSQYSDKYTTPPQVNFDERFNLAFRMSIGPDHLFENLDKIKIKLYKVTIYRSNFSNLTSEEVPMSRCNKNRFRFHPDDFESYNLTYSLCPESMNDRFIVGAFLSEYYIYYQARFVMCENDPVTGMSNDREKIVCKPPSEIEEWLRTNGVRAHIFYSDFNYDPNNYDDPNTTYLNNYNIDITFNTVKENHLYFQYLNLTSDDTYFFLAPASRTFSGIANNYFAERPAYRESYFKNFVLLNVRTDKTAYSFKRSYMLFSQTVANIGAILNICLLFFKVIIFAISRMQFFTRLVRNSIYFYYTNPQIIMKLDSGEKELKKGNMISKNLEESKMNILEKNMSNDKTLQASKQIEMLYFKKTNVENTSHDLKLVQKVTKVDIDMLQKLENFSITKYNSEPSFIELFIYSICPCVRVCHNKVDMNLHIIEYSRKHYYKYTDFFKFLDKFIEINILKKLLLSKEEFEVIEILKRLVMVKNLEVLDIIKPAFVSNNKSTTQGNILNEKLKKKGSLPEYEEKLKKFLTNAAEKPNKSKFEANLIEKFDDIFKP